MNKYYTAYIHRGNTELEVTAQVYDYGRVEEGYDNLGGYWAEVTEDPVFVDYVAFDDYGVELTLTPREILDSEKQMIEEYWNSYEDSKWGYGT